jgi:hypothetical protein
MAWERCGNTPYYVKRDGESASYVNPFDWSHISVGVEPGPDWAGSASILYRRAPRYDFDILKNGSKHVFVADEIPQILRATHEWFADLMRAKEAKISPRDLRKLFEGAPQEVQDLVLEGVRGLVQGYDEAGFGEMMKLKNLENPEKWFGDNSITLVAVGKNTRAAGDIAGLKEFHNHAKKFFIGDTTEDAIDQALAYFGIHEC